MAVRARFSIALLMIVVLVAGADFAIVAAAMNGPGPAFAIGVTTLPTANLLLLTLPRLRRQGARPFWLGFEAAGWAAVLLVAHLAWSHQSELFSPMEWIDRLNLAPNAEFSFFIVVAFVVYTAPQVLAATVGGWLSTRYRVTIERRPSALSGGA